MIKHFNGVPVLIPNTITTSNDDEQYYISYNPSRRDYGVDTTALVITIGNNERTLFYILKGNHADAFKECSDLTSCVRYFMDNEELIHPMGEPFEHQHLL